MGPPAAVRAPLHIQPEPATLELALGQTSPSRTRHSSLVFVSMRPSIVASVAALVLAATLASSAGAARKPTPSERAAITLAAIEGVPHVDGIAAIFVVRRVVMSTVRPGSNASFSSFGAAFGVAKDQSGLYPTGPRIALVGRHRRTRAWITVGYGVNRVLCHEPQSLFGGRRAAILRDLDIRCPQVD
jgi:hypothetical protein